ncbi:Carboxysome Shell Carbonic Anhydrase [Aquimonas voraii]|uniref:Carboxysome Shell Carbonic Anhydrase n=2 Tax=Aquimonas voraii TaxID=265719 RepID=A0A1G6SMU4_9GAMM|nr:Carboxysome Shell Carbonic Anhydrase [Aquimonas voraii]
MQGESMLDARAAGGDADGEGMHARPIAERIDWLLARAEQHSQVFSASDSVLARERYRALHPTALAAMKCMDGRLNLAYATGTPIGLIQPFRNLGGRFDLGWPHLGEVLSAWVLRQIREGRRVLLLLTYHFARGSRERGCAGFGFDTAAAQAHVQGLRQQVERVFGQGHDAVYPLVCGFETDEDALCLHAPGGEVLDLAGLREDEAGALPQRLLTLFPDMPAQVREDLLPLLLGNLRHVGAIRASQRPLEVEHHEWVLCVGRGFDVLHMPNHALIVGPYSPRLDQSIATAAGIIESNMRSGRIPDDGFLLLASVPYEEPGPDRARAELKARFLCEFSCELIRERHPWLAGRMHVQRAVLDWPRRQLQLLRA